MSDEFIRLHALITETLPEGITTRGEALLWVQEFRSRWVRIDFSLPSLACIKTFQILFVEESAALGQNPGLDPTVQRALACSCYRLLDLITAEWYYLAPELLGSLSPIVRDLPPGQTLYDTYPPPAEAPLLAPAPVPAPSFAPHPLPELFELRAALRRTADIPSECASAVRAAVGNLTSSREDYQQAHSASLPVRNAERYRFFQAHLFLYSTVMDSELSIIERRSYWDRVVRLLRGNWFFTYFNFEEEEEEEDEEPHLGYFGALSEEIQNGPAPYL
jgi:hypothetical protein